MPTDDTLKRTFDFLASGLGLHWTAKSAVDHGICGGWAVIPDHLQSHVEAQAGWNFYLSLNAPHGLFKGTKPSKTDILRLNTLGIDIDIVDSTPEKQEAAQHIVTDICYTLFPRKRFMIVDSGRGLWVWLRTLGIPYETPEQRADIDLILRAFVRHFAFANALRLASFDGQVDESCAEISRLARCPGTINHKNGRTAAIVSMNSSLSTGALTLDELREFAGPFMDMLRLQPAPAPGPPLVDMATILTHLNLTSRQFVMHGTHHSVESRHRRLFSTACNMVELNVPQEVAAPMLYDAAARCTPRLESSAVDRVLRDVWNSRI